MKTERADSQKKKVSRSFSKRGLTDLASQMPFPKFENSYEAGFLKVKVCDVFASRLPLGKLPTLTLEKSHLKPFSDFGKKNYSHGTKPALPSNFLLGPKGIWEVFGDFVILKF
jgi:hypothetical protein